MVGFAFILTAFLLALACMDGNRVLTLSEMGYGILIIFPVALIGSFFLIRKYKFT